MERRTIKSKSLSSSKLRKGVLKGRGEISLELEKADERGLSVGQVRFAQEECSICCCVA